MLPMPLDTAADTPALAARRSRAAKFRWVRLLLAAALLTGYGAWAALSWHGQYRAVSADQLRTDLRLQDVDAFALSPRVAMHAAWPLQLSGGVGNGTLDMADTAPTGGIVLYRTASGQTRYVVGDPAVEPATVTSGGGYQLAGPTALSQTLQRELESAGVPQRGGWPANDLPELLGVIVGGLCLVGLLAGPDPAVGTRWFWFFVLGLPLGLGMLGYAAALLAPPAPDGGRAETWLRAGPGFVLSLAGTAVVVLLLHLLRLTAGTLLIAG